MKKIVKLGIGLLLIITVLLVMLILISPRFANAWDFINDKTCAPPCLGNIIPGVTTQTEALNIVSANKAFGTCDLVDLSQQGGIKYIRCQSYKRSMNITLDDDRVTGIGIHPYPNYSLKTIVDRLGYPEWISCGLVNLPDHQKRVKPILWFDKYSTSVSLPEMASDQCALSPTLEIETIVYESVDNYRENKSAIERLKNIMTWEGFRTYPGKDLP